MNAAARATLALYSGSRPSTRLHVRVRWASCPFPEVAAAVPMAGRVLEVGCGHGLFSAYLAVTSPARDVHGVDLDVGKITDAHDASARARERGVRLSFEAAPSGAVPEGPWEAVVIVDVLYLLHPADQRRLLADCAAQLAPGGVLLVKEMSERPRWKYLVNLAQETVSVRLLGITEGREMTFLPPAELAEEMRIDGLDVTARRIDRRRPHPHHLLVGRKPQRAG